MEFNIEGKQKIGGGIEKPQSVTQAIIKHYGNLYPDKAFINIPVIQENGMILGMGFRNPIFWKKKKKMLEARIGRKTISRE